jgi:uncharacterized protein (TIGR02145 family)
LLFFFCASLHAQVTIGSLEEPRAGTVLDLNSAVKGGLILSNVTIANPELIPYDTNAFPGITTDADADENPGLRGAIVYNDGQNLAVPAGIYIWNGYCWTKDGGDITVATPSITANGLTGTAVTFTGPVTFAVVSPQPDVTYQWFSSTSLSPSDGTPAGTGNTTTLTLEEGTYFYYCEASSASCPSFNEFSSVITVTVIPNPLSLSVGDGVFSGKTCFDVVQTNNSAECGLIANRLSGQHSFSDKPTETYEFTPIGDPTGLMFVCKNLDPLHPVIQSISQSDYQVTVTFSPGLDEAAAGLTRANALKAELYAVFMSGGTPQQLTLTLSVSDCLCCPGLFIPGGEYEDIAATPTLPYGSTATNTDGSAAYKLLSSTDANGFANKKTGNGLCYYYRSANLSGAGSATPTGYTWGNATTVCQTIQGIDADDAHADWRLPNLGELAQIGQLVSNTPTWAVNVNIISLAEINKAINKGTGYDPFGSLPAGTMLANNTENLISAAHWSSTEYDNFTVWRWLYSTNYRYAYTSNTTTTSNLVRCVRSF